MYSGQTFSMDFKRLHNKISSPFLYSLAESFLQVKEDFCHRQRLFWQSQIKVQVGLDTQNERSVPSESSDN